MYEFVNDYYHILLYLLDLWTNLWRKYGHLLQLC